MKHGDMIKCVMIQLCKYLAGLSYLALYVLSCYKLFGLTATFLIVGVQLLVHQYNQHLPDDMYHSKNKTSYD